MRSVVIFSALALIASIVVPRLAMQSQAPRPKRMMAAQPASTPAATPATTDSRSVIIPPNEQGHFQVDGRVDGRRLSFMIDTGASMIALTAEDAARLGIHPPERDFSALVKTANGVINAARVQLDTVEIEDLALHDVDALVMPEGALSDDLLGLSFLSRLRRFEYAEGRLVLEQ